MIIDNEAELVTTVALDLETIRPGSGQPLKLWAKLDADGDLTITTGDAVAAADNLMVVACVGITEFELPSSVKRYIKSTFAGRVAVSLAGIQTAK